MTSASLPGGAVVNYGYDPMGRRASRTTNGLTTNFLYDGGDVVLDRGSDGNTVEYLNGTGVDDKLRQRSTTGPLYFLQDQLGSTAALTDAAGGVVERIQFEPFGNSAGSALTRFGFTGREHDGATGLIYFRARWYDPSQGRFVSEDPIGVAGGFNLYAYAGNNPVGLRDPFGLQPQTPSDWADAADRWIDRKTDKMMTTSWVLNWAILNNASVVKIGTDLLRVGRGVGDAIYGDGDWLDKSIGIVQDAGRAAAIFAILRGIAGTAQAGLRSFRKSPTPKVGKPGLPCNTGPTGKPGPNRIYSARELIRRAQEPGLFHNFPESLDKTIFEQGTSTVTPNLWRTPKPGLSNDSVMYRLRGTINGVDGTFEIGVRPSSSGNTEVIMHRFFRPDR